jgi:hypothetical protein
MDFGSQSTSPARSMSPRSTSSSRSASPDSVDFENQDITQSATQTTKLSDTSRRLLEDRSFFQLGGYTTDVESSDDGLDGDSMVLDTANTDQRCLRSIIREEKEGWVLKAKVSFSKLGRYFDDLPFDTRTQNYSRSNLITEIRSQKFDIPSLRRDPRATTVTLGWKSKLSTSDQELIHQHIQQKRPVYRMVCYCKSYDEFKVIPKSILNGWKEPEDRPPVPKEIKDRMTLREYAVYHRCQSSSDQKVLEGSKMKGVENVKSRKGRKQYTCNVQIHIEVIPNLNFIRSLK